MGALSHSIVVRYVVDNIIMHVTSTKGARGRGGRWENVKLQVGEGGG